MLLEKGAKLDTKDRDGRTPLSYAIQYRYKEMVKPLLDNGANMETRYREYGWTPLFVL